MKITSLHIGNYRTLDNLDLTFPGSYAAICGPNDSGKTNVVRAVRALMKEENAGTFVQFGDDEVSFKNDYPKWKSAANGPKKIELALSLSVDPVRDAGFFQFLVKQLSLQAPEAPLDMSVEVTYRDDRNEPSVSVEALGNRYVSLEAQEVLKRLQSSRSILFHNSTETMPRVFARSGFGGSLRAMSVEHQVLVAAMKKTVERGLAKISKGHQKDLETLLGRLETKYKVGPSMPTFDFDHLPARITLGQAAPEVALDDWGSGTRNRTLMLLTLFRAQQISASATSASKITPVIVIEEPESFLHPSAQAEFGRVLHDLAEEFQVQVIVTTHSPYMLSMENPTSNVLLCRRTHYKQAKETERVDTSGDEWMQPFAIALGMESQEFKPWKKLIFSGSDAILLVEGETDKEYFELLRNPAHGPNQLNFTGEIVPYDGTGSLKNNVLMRFVKNRYRKLFVTFDLDEATELERCLQILGLERKKHFYPIGLNAAGKKNIEGMLPESVTKAVYASNADLVQAATAGTKDEQTSARNRLKRLYLEEFKRTATPGQEYYGAFYAVVRIINAALS